MADSSADDEVPLATLKTRNKYAEEDEIPLSDLKKKIISKPSESGASVLEVPAGLETVALNEPIEILADTEQCRNEQCMCEDQVDSDLLSDSSDDYDYDSDRDPAFSPGAYELC
ncbi:hypothetical protein RRG08_005592 [Elysia crispata]|uniref:Uncharacterized protein n=1 Tax=Elysia crispata TaxID=231223 RepID=A0AAE0YYR4_9GAST|nr:hypothetical protein RRG08_005592 [Elysia crispata]